MLFLVQVIKRRYCGLVHTQSSISFHSYHGNTVTLLWFLCIVHESEITPTTLRDIRHTEEVDERCYLNGTLEKWEYLKGAIRIPRVKQNGEPYFFSEGVVCFPDNIDKPRRAMRTRESSVNRSTHAAVISG